MGKREVWALNPMSERIAATSAFTVGRTKNSKGSRLGLSQEEVRDTMSWVDAKSALWGVEPMTIYGYLRTEEAVAADLVRNSRPDARQAPEPDSLPRSTLTRIGIQIPDREEVQRSVASVIVRHKLSGTGISSILSDVKHMSDDEALAYLETVDFTAYKEKIADRQIYRYPEEDILRLDRVRETSRVRPLSEIASLTAIHVELVLNEGGFDEERMKNVADELGRIASQILDAASRIEGTVEGKSAGERTDAKAAIRPISEFTDSLTEFMRDASLPIEILTDREARAADAHWSVDEARKIHYLRFGKYLKHITANLVDKRARNTHSLHGKTRSTL